MQSNESVMSTGVTGQTHVLDRKIILIANDGRSPLQNPDEPRSLQTSQLGTC